MQINSSRGWIYVFTIVLSLSLFHLIINLYVGLLPHSIKYFLNPIDNYVLSDMYLEDGGGASLSYIIRNFFLRYSIYPVMIFTFIVDRYSLFTKFNLSYRKLSVLLLITVSIFLLLSNPYLEGYNYFPHIFLYQIVFVNSSAAMYVYALPLFLVSIIIIYRYLVLKMPWHLALWFSFLIFMSYEEVWEYAVYIYYALPINIMDIVDIPLNNISLWLWRATPTILLIFYSLKQGFIKPIRNSVLTKTFLVALIISIILIVFPVYSTWISVSLRFFWMLFYISFSYSFYRRPLHLPIQRE